jgi:hypothetical protein
MLRCAHAEEEEEQGGEEEWRGEEEQCVEEEECGEDEEAELDGSSPKELAPNLYLRARFKYRIVFTKLKKLNWIRNIRDISSPSLLEEFILLFMALSQVELTLEKDRIKWRWTTDGQYIVKSAYECQFQGSIQQPLFHAMWEARSEPKCFFFAWLAMHDRCSQLIICLGKTGLVNIIAPSACVCMNRLKFTATTWRQLGTS